MNLTFIGNEMLRFKNTKYLVPTHFYFSNRYLTSCMKLLVPTDFYCSDCSLTCMKLLDQLSFFSQVIIFGMFAISVSVNQISLAFVKCYIGLTKLAL